MNKKIRRFVFLQTWEAALRMGAKTVARPDTVCIVFHGTGTEELPGLSK